MVRKGFCEIEESFSTLDLLNYCRNVTPNRKLYLSQLTKCNAQWLCIGINAAI